MNKSVIQKLIVPYLLLSGAAFTTLAVGLDPGTLIITLNSLFVGTMISITVSYGGVLFPAMFGVKPYDDVRQMAIGIMLSWSAYGMVVISSVYVRAADLPTTSLLWSALGRWIAINSAIIQITAPDFGQGFFYGRDRKLLWGGLLAGSIFAIGAYFLQTEQALS